MRGFIVFIIISTYAQLVNALPPPTCFANFRWDDCGRTPEPVFYYWKPGSRCEVGIWRGCLPNINMFRDEYECVSTCIFAVRASPPDWHIINSAEEFTTMETTSTITTGAAINITEGDAAGSSNNTDSDDHSNKEEAVVTTIPTTTPSTEAG